MFLKPDDNSKPSFKPKKYLKGHEMGNQKSDTKISRRAFLSLTNKAGVALISAGSILSVIHPQKALSAPKNGENEKFKEMKPVRNRAIVTKKSRKNKTIVSSTLTFKEKNYLLNSEGSFIWNLCNGRHSLNMIADALSLRHRKAASTVGNDVTRFIHALKSSNLIEFVN
jgi:hypothetical protein